MYGVVAEPASVPAWLEGLGVAIGVRCPTGQLVPAGVGLPQIAPALPSKFFALRRKRGLLPAPVDRNLDLRDGHAAPRPGATEKLGRAGVEQAVAIVPVGNPGRHQQRFNAHVRDWRSRLAWCRAIVVADGLLKSLVGLRERFDLRQPFDIAH